MYAATRYLGTLLLGSLLAITPLPALEFEKLDSWSDDGFDLSAEMFFSDDSTLWAFRNEYAIRMSRGWKTPLSLWARSGIEIPEGVPDWLRKYYNAYLLRFDPVTSTLVVPYLNGDAGEATLFRMLDLKKAVWTGELEWNGSKFPCTPSFYQQDNVFIDEFEKRYGMVLPRGPAFTASTVLSFDETTGIAKIDLRTFKDCSDYDEMVYLSHRTISMDTIEMGELTGVRMHTPLERVLWTDGKEFIFISKSNCYMGYLRLEEGVEHYKLIVIPGTFFLLASYKITDSRGIEVRLGNPYLALDAGGYVGMPYFGCVKTWGHSFLMLDASPVKQVVTDIESLGRVFKLNSSGPDWLDRDKDISMLDSIYHNVIIPSGWSKGFSHSWNGSFFSPLDSTISMPYRIAAYDPRTNSVKDTELPYFYTLGLYPLAISPKGNLLAFAEKDPATGRFVSYSIYRILLDAEVNDERVRYRSAPSMKGTVLGMFEKGDRVKILDRSDEKSKIDTYEDYWYHVRLNNGNEAWAYGAFLSILD